MFFCESFTDHNTSDLFLGNFLSLKEKEIKG